MLLRRREDGEYLRMGRTGEHVGKQGLQDATGGNGEERLTVLAVLEGNGNRPSHKGPGISIGGGTMYCLNSVEVHAVAIRRNRL